MSRIARLKVKGEPAVYHIMSRTALDGFVIGDVEKDYFLSLIKKISSAYFVEVYGFCLMGNHFHLLVQMNPGSDYSDEEIRRRHKLYYGEKGKIELTQGQIPYFRERWSNLSEYVKDIKQTFSRYFNKRNNRKGFFWSERFKSLIAERGETLINCLAYIDLNPVRAGIVDRPEEYRWSSLGYHMQTRNKDDFLSTDFGLREFALKGDDERLTHYRSHVYKKGMPGSEIESINEFEVTKFDRLRYRTRYFTDSGIIGSKAFVSRSYNIFKDYFECRHDKQPRPIQGLDGIYSLKRLSEKL